MALLCGCGCGLPVTGLRWFRVPRAVAEGLVAMSAYFLPEKLPAGFRHAYRDIAGAISPR